MFQTIWWRYRQHASVRVFRVGIGSDAEFESGAEGGAEGLARLDRNPEVVVERPAEVGAHKVAYV
eukprot:7009745-Prorocentrum_lima.AAC.1